MIYIVAAMFLALTIISVGIVAVTIQVAGDYDEYIEE